MADHYKRWESSVNTRPSFSSDANLNAPAEPVNAVAVDFIARADEALSDLNKAVDEFNGDNGRTAQAIVDAKLEVTRIKAELYAAEQRLKVLEAAGSALDKYNGLVSRAEGAYQKLVELFTKQVEGSILAGWYGRAVSIQAISKDRKNDLRLHKRIQDLQQFVHVGRFEYNVTADDVSKKVDVIGSKLIQLKDYIAAEKTKEA